MNAKLLIIEDDPLQQKLYNLLCQRFRMQADYATSSAQACAMLQQSSGKYEIILLDWMLGAESGLDCIAKIRSLTKSWQCYVPIIAVTAHALTGDREICITAGADDYMSKPFSLAQFEHMILKWLKVARQKPAHLIGWMPPLRNPRFDANAG